MRQSERFEAEFAALGASLLRARHRGEIERAIDRARGVGLGNWIRGERSWAAARRRGFRTDAGGRQGADPETGEVAGTWRSRYQYTSGE